MKRFFIKVNLSLLLLFFYISPIFALQLYVGGQSVGIVLNYGGVYVSGTYPINYAGVTYEPNRDSNIISGDLIIAVNNQNVTRVEDLYLTLKDELDKNQESVSVSIKRNNEIIQRELKIFDQNGTMNCGLYVKDSATGIGTLTFINPQNSSFGALGHDIVDNTNIRLANGELFHTTITGIKKSTNASVGEKIANADSFRYLGKVYANNIYGVYGKYDGGLTNYSLIDVGTRDEVHLGKAYIRTVLNGDIVDQYEIEITKVNKQLLMDKKGIQFKITDQRLLNSTGGIIQGMSGSPIIQDNKIIGAVTHVVVNNPSNGYGVFIEFMIENGNKIIE